MTPLQVPQDWSPQEAYIVFDYLDQLRDAIWAHYGHAIQQWCAQNHLYTHDSSQPDLFEPNDPLPF